MQDVVEHKLSRQRRGG